MSRSKLGWLVAGVVLSSLFVAAPARLPDGSLKNRKNGESGVSSIRVSPDFRLAS